MTRYTSILLAAADPASICWCGQAATFQVRNANVRWSEWNSFCSLGVEGNRNEKKNLTLLDKPVFMKLPEMDA